MKQEQRTADVQMAFRLTVEEKADIEAIAREVGMKASPFIRAAMKAQARKIRQHLAEGQDVLTALTA
jgi:hypothetical protein